MRYVIGIDEVGRGALAGPVMVAAVALPKNFRLKGKLRRRGVGVPTEASGDLGPLRDSKKLSPIQRKKWFGYLVGHQALCYSIARVYPRRIEKMNISAAANFAATRALERLVTAKSIRPRFCRVFLDGGLYLMKQKHNPSTDSGRMIARTIIRGDEKINAIKVASILAKVSRDRFMVRLAKQYPEYGFEIHKGYGTLRHRKAIKKHGPCGAHRKTFLG